MFEIRQSMGLSFVTRSKSVDQDTLDWMSESLFVSELSKFQFSRESYVLDLGSHIGAFSIIAARQKKCKVLAYEPDTQSYRISLCNAIINEVDHLIEFFNMAIGDYDGKTILYESDENWGHTTIADGGPYNKLTGNSSVVEIISLEKALSRIPDQSNIFVKFNIEGSEFEMINKSSNKCLERINTFVGEVHYDLGLGDFTSCSQRLKDSGFDVELIPDGQVRAYLIARKVK